MQNGHNFGKNVPKWVPKEGNGRIFRKNVPKMANGHENGKNVAKRMRKVADGHVSSKNVAVLSGRSLMARPHQRPSGGREPAGMRKIAKSKQGVAESSKFGIARERE